MVEYDISVVLNLHDEGRYLNRTLLSLSEAAVYASRLGISLELIAVLDRADETTAGILRRARLDAFRKVRVLEVDNGSLSLSRNDGCLAARGSFIATADGDDLVSFNYFERMFFQSGREGQSSILIPQFHFGFGADYYICEFFSLDEVTPLTLINIHPFGSRIFCNRQVFSDILFEDVRLSTGYAYEDWHFNCDAVSRGYTIRVCDETILFYRRRDTSLLARADSMSMRQSPPSAFFLPERYISICAPFLPRMTGDRGQAKPSILLGQAVLDDPLYRVLVAAASRIDPAIDIEKYQYSHYFNYLSADRNVGSAYATMCHILGRKTFDEIFLMPFLTTRGVDRYIIDVMSALAQARPAVWMLVLFGEPLKKYAWLDRLPSAAVCINLPGRFPSLSEDDIALLSLKIIQGFGSNARLHLKGSQFAESFFSRFGRLLGRHKPVFYRSLDGHMTFGGKDFIESGPFEFVSANIECLDRLVCDNAGIMAFDRQRICIDPDKWRLLYAKVALPPAPDWAQIDAAAATRKVLWGSRMDRQKRPGLLTRIAELLADRLPDVQLDTYGAATLDDMPTTQFAGMPNARHHDAYNRLEDIGAGNYYCCVYTSLFDGMPNVLLETAAAGAAIIAPDVGGIGEFIHDGETGLLVTCRGDDETDAQSYVDAIARLFEDPAVRRSMIEGAFRLLQERHSPESYQANVAEVFDLGVPGDALPSAAASMAFPQDDRVGEAGTGHNQ
jgi:glycosyltransferase involved in cell wall biosynthesis